MTKSPIQTLWAASADNMRITEVADPQIANKGQLEAIAQFLIGRADDTSAEKQISVPAFLNIAGNMGMSMTKDQLITLSQQPPLSNLIDNIQGDQIIFKGSQIPDVDMSVDKAREVVDKNAKSAMKRAMK